MAMQFYYVDIDQADDPEACHGYTWTAQQIVENLPFLTGLIVGDGTESLTYTHELERIHIRPAFCEDLR